MGGPLCDGDIEDLAIDTTGNGRSLERHLCVTCAWHDIPVRISDGKVLSRPSLPLDSATGLPIINQTNTQDVWRVSQKPSPDQRTHKV
jgi:nitrite reductase/ring-hydroxylating ferredoxin subunit